MASKEESKPINIMVIGETGVGKSTFINAFANYMLYSNLEEAAQAQEITYLVPTKFSVTDEDFQDKTVSIGDDENECNVAGASATQCAKNYIFPIDGGRTLIRLIDTPGIGDTRGIDQDNANMEGVLDYINQFDELHGICILLKPNNARLTVLFEFCIKQLLSRLEKSASCNIIFVFTNSRCTFYRPGDTMSALKKILKEIESNPPFVQIPCNKNNVFCMDNEAFRFLVCMKNSITFSEDEKCDFALSWENSSTACRNLIKYVCGDADCAPLAAHKIKDTISINRARSIVIELSKPLAEIVQIIIDNLNRLKEHKNTLKHEGKTVKEIKEKMYLPVSTLKVKELNQPRTVCTNPSCCTSYKVDGKTNWLYTTICHDPCKLNNIAKNVVGSPELANCAVFLNGKTCVKCNCEFSVHMHIYYETEVNFERVFDQNIHSQINNKQTAIKELNNLTGKINKECCAFNKEIDFIIESTAKFAYFIQINSITPYNDIFEAYITFLITREYDLGENGDKQLTTCLQNLLKQYNKEKYNLNQAGKVVTAEDIFETIARLYNLPFAGGKLMELSDKQTNAQLSEQNQNTKIVDPKGVYRPDERYGKRHNEIVGEDNVTVDDQCQKQIVKNDVVNNVIQEQGQKQPKNNSTKSKQLKNTHNDVHNLNQVQAESRTNKHKSTCPQKEENPKSVNKKDKTYSEAVQASQKTAEDKKKFKQELADLFSDDSTDDDTSAMEEHMRPVCVKLAKESSVGVVTRILSKFNPFK